VKKIKKTLFGFFFRLGVIPQRIYPPEHIAIFIENLPTAIKEHELKKHVDTVVRANNHSYYESMLKGFIKEGDVNIRKATFIGNGMGEASLNIYRKVLIDGKFYFEKVFFNDRIELQTAIWFQQHVFGSLNGQIVTAALTKLLKGDFITIAYFEFLELSPFPAVAGDYDEFIKLTIDLYQLSCTNPLVIEAQDTPVHIRDFRFHFQYQRNASAAEQKLTQLGIDFEELIATVDLSKKILSHGDINPGNAFKGSILIDWDSFGIYPVGLEVAYLYYRMPVRDKRHMNPTKWLTDNYKAAIDSIDWPSFERNFFFFAYIFAFHLFEEKDYADLERQIINNLHSVKKR